MIAEAVLMASDSDYVKLLSVARSAMPDKATGTRFLVPKMVSTKRVRILGLASEHDEGAAKSRRTARVWVQAEQLDVGAAVRRVRGGSSAGARSTGAMHKVPSFTMSTGKRPVGGIGAAKAAAPRDDVAAHIEKTVRVYRIVCVDPSQEQEEVLVVTTGPGRRGSTASGRMQVLSLRGVVPKSLLDPTMERALVTHLCEERAAHAEGAGSSLGVLAVSARAIGLRAGEAPKGWEEGEFVVEAKCDGESISVWRVLEDDKGQGVAAAGGSAPVPLVLNLLDAAAKAGVEALVANGDITGALLAIAGRVGMAPPAEAGGRPELRLVSLAEGAEVAAASAAAAASTAEGQADAAAAAAARDAVATEDGTDVWRDTWAVADADLAAAAAEGPFPDDPPKAADPDAPIPRILHSRTRRQPMAPTPLASKRATLLGLDGGPRSSPFEPRAGIAAASGSGRVRLIARLLHCRAAGGAGALAPLSEGATPSLLWVSSLDPASGAERCAAFSAGATPASAAEGGAVPLEGLVPSGLLAPQAVLALATHLLDDRVSYGSTAARWWRREAVSWAQMPAVADGLAAASGGADQTVVRIQGDDARALAAAALPAVRPAAASAPLVLTPSLARGVGLVRELEGEEATGAPEGAETRLFVVEARCAGDAAVLRLVVPPEGTEAVLRASSRVGGTGIRERGLVDGLASPPAPLVVGIDALAAATGTTGMDVPLRSLLLSGAERVSLVPVEGGGMELRLVPRPAE